MAQNERFRRTLEALSPVEQDDESVILQARGVSKWFGGSADNPPVMVLDGVDLSIREGEFVALLGPSGSGKTTFLRILAGVSEPSKGEVLYHGEPLRGVNPGVSVVFQSFALFPWMSVLENVELGLKASGMDLKKAKARAVAAIDMIGLDGFEDALPRELSGGMKQRVGFARALAVEPELLCMDEPFSGLDVLTAENLRMELMDLWLEKKIPTRAILAITHSIEEAVMMADKVVIFWHNPGRVAAVLKVGLSHPRDKKSPAFKKLIDQIYTILVRQSEVETRASQRPLALRKFQKLPHARLGALSGLLDLVNERGGREDVYELEGELNMEADDLLELTEAASVLGMASLEEGDIRLTELGRRFVDGDILSRKDVFREAVAGSVVVINQILQALNTASNHSMNEEFFLDVLENHFTEDEASRQLQTAIDWGRYAELFAYEEQSGLLYLEEAEA